MDDGVLVGARVYTVGLLVSDGNRLGLAVGPGQVSTSRAEQSEALALQLVAPQHEYGVGVRQSAHNEVSLRSAGPAQLKQSKDPVPAYAVLSGQRL